MSSPGTHRPGVGQQRTVGACHDGEPTRERSERADGIEPALCQRQTVRGARHTIDRGMMEPRMQALVARAPFAQGVQRRAAQKPPVRLREASAGAVHPRQRRPAEALRKVIESLHLLMQA